MSSSHYFQYEKEINTIPLKNNSSEFMVLSVKEEVPKKKKKIENEINDEKIYEIEIARVSDWETFTVRSHLGNILKENNIVLGKKKENSK